MVAIGKKQKSLLKNGTEQIELKLCICNDVWYYKKIPSDIQYGYNLNIYMYIVVKH